MAEIARRLSPEDLSAVTAFLSSEAVPANTHAVSADAPVAPRRRKGRKAEPEPAPAPPPMRCGAVPLPGSEATR
jgi:hypothetical protein